MYRLAFASLTTLAMPCTSSTTSNFDASQPYEIVGTVTQEMHLGNSAYDCESTLVWSYQSAAVFGSPPSSVDLHRVVDETRVSSTCWWPEADNYMLPGTTQMEVAIDLSGEVLWEDQYLQGWDAYNGVISGDSFAGENAQFYPSLMVDGVARDAVLTATWDVYWQNTP
jgi:hypothetical protein